MSHKTHTDFEFDNNFNIKNNFTRVLYGNNRPLLEVELNEMQKIQEESKASIIKRIVPSGFIYLKRADIKGDTIICNPNNEPYTIALAPSKMIMNGYEVTIEGNTTLNDMGKDKDGYLKIVLPPSPDTLYREDFVFLEFWFEEISYLSTVREYGYENGNILSNAIFDSRINDETARRIALKWRVRIIENHNFDKWENGFGYIDDSNFSPIYAYGAKNSKVDKIEYVFRPATDDIFKDCNFYGDNGLWVAGRPGFDDIIHDLGVVENFVFAVPLLKVKRRNSSEYSIENPNGASTWVDKNSVSTHPNGLFHNMFVKEDIIDLRRTISFNGWDTDRLLEKSLKSLVTGNLQTSKKEIMHRAQFGISPINSSHPNLIFLSRFNGNPTTTVGTGNPNKVNGEPLKYGLSATGDGVILDGKSSIEYNLTSFNRERGTIEFFLKPFWGSSDESINQTIFTIKDTVYNTNVFEFKKEGNNLVFINRRNNSGLAGDEYKTYIDLLEYPIIARKIYHFKITWEYSNSYSGGYIGSGSLVIYINGKNVKGNSYVSTDLNPNVLQIGEIETYDDDFIDTKTILDEFAIYNEVISNFENLNYDFIRNEATIYPSFNNYFNSFHDNEYKQLNYVKEITTTASTNTFQLNALYHSVISTDTPVVYDSSGKIYNGTWSGLGTSNATFTLISGPNGETQFNGEKVYVQHNIIVEAGYGSFELPTKILKAEFNGQPAVFNPINSAPTLVKLEDSDGEIYDAYDYSTSNRNNDECFTRIIHYRIKGNGQDRYYIPHSLFGYEIIGIKYVGKRFDNIKKLTNNPNYRFEIELSEALLNGQTTEVHLMCGGLAFEYQIHTKNLISNTLKTTTLQVTAPGNTEEFTVMVDVNSGYNTIVASSNIVKDVYDINGNVVGQQTKFIAFKNGLQVELEEISGFGTPFLTFKFSSTPLAGDIIEIPILATYSPKNTDIISVWYTHVPYQGILNNKPKKLKRISKWLPFVTTLSSGKLIVNNPPNKSINNAFNRLPGGGSYSHMLIGEEIEFKNDNYSDIDGYSINKYFVTTNEYKNININNDLDDYLLELDNEFIIRKLQSNFQNGKLDVPFNLQGLFLQDTKSSIIKYVGASCLVVDEEGQILLFIFGHTNNFKSTISTIAKPVYGDLFYLDGRPTMLNNKI